MKAHLHIRGLEQTRYLTPDFEDDVTEVICIESQARFMSGDESDNGNEDSDDDEDEISSHVKEIKAFAIESAAIARLGDKQ